MLNLEAAQDLFIAIAKRALSDSASVKPELQAEAAEFLTYQIPDWRDRWEPRPKTNRGRKNSTL